MAAHPARTALLEAIVRGREPPAIIRTRIPASQRPRPPCLSGLTIEDLEYQSEEGPQGWVPLRLASLPPTESSPAPTGQPPNRQLPAIVLMHPTGSDMSFAANWQASFARRGYLAAAIDSRYHGARVDPLMPYQEALVRAWKGNAPASVPSNEHPFLLDTVWDLMRLVDLLSTRPDVDPARIAVSGFSLGGMHSWLLAAADVRIAAAAPVAGVQYFRHAIETNQFMSRYESIPLVFHAASKALGKRRGEVDAEVVEQVWHRMLPGMLESYDAPGLLAATAPRSLFVVSGEVDPRCPADGVHIAVEEAKRVYKTAGVEDELKVFLEEGAGHDLTYRMVEEIDAWMDAKLKP